MNPMIILATCSACCNVLYTGFCAFAATGTMNIHEQCTMVIETSTMRHRDVQVALSSGCQVVEATNQAAASMDVF